MKKLYFPPLCVSIFGATEAIVLLMLTSTPAQAINATWTNGASDNLWQSSGNWSATPLPGTTSGFANTETATFNTSGSGIIDLGGTLNIQNISFGSNGSNANSFTIGDADDILNLTSGGSITIGGSVTANETIGTSGGTINLADTNNSTYSFINNGSGVLTIAGAVTANQASTYVSTLTLGGVGSGSVTGALSGAGTAGDAGLNLVKNGSGTWTLSGANTYTGSTKVYGGTLVLDYATNTPISATSAVTLSGGGMVVKGKSTGVTTASISSLALGDAAGAVNTFTLDANSGSGVSLTIGTLSAYNSSRSNTLFDLSSSSANTITISALGTYASVYSGVLMSGTSSAVRLATIIVHDSTGYGFATLSGGTLGRLSTGTTLTESAAVAATNYRLTTSGTLTRTADMNFNTVTIDSTAGAITLDMGAYSMNANAQGRAILVTGDNDVTISGTGSLGAVALINNYSSGTLSISLSAATSATVFTGTGFTDYSGTVTGGQLAFEVGGGIVRLSKAQNLTGSPYIVTGGGVLEIGADLSGTTGWDLSNTIGSVSSNIRFIGDSGLSAANGNRVVNFGGNTTPSKITWGSSWFLTNVDGTTDGGYTLLLSSAKSDASIEIQNPIALGTDTTRVVEVANGSADTDAILSGTLSGSGATLNKTGDGTLALTATNTYTGATNVNAGQLSVIGLLSSSSAVNVASGATLAGSGTANGVVTVNGGTIKGSGLKLGATTFRGASTLSGTTTAASIAVSTGTTSVSAGAKATAATVSVATGAILTNNGTLTGAVDVTGILNGTGTVEGSLTIKSTGELAPGNSPGITTVTGALVVESGAKVSMQIDGLTGAGVTGGYDQIVVTSTGSITLDLGSILSLSLNTTLAINDTITLIDNQTTAAISGTFTSVMVLGTAVTLGANNIFSYGGQEFALSYTGTASGSAVGNDLILTVVPEPATWAMLVGGIGMLVGLQRFRRKM